MISEKSISEFYNAEIAREESNSSYCELDDMDEYEYQQEIVLMDDDFQQDFDEDNEIDDDKNDILTNIEFTEYSNDKLEKIELLREKLKEISKDYNELLSEEKK